MFSIVAEMECPFVNVGDLIKYKTMPPTDSVENCYMKVHIVVF